ncbi:MAG: class I mannose-6-phosphate isomerase [Bacteroidales bacterium]|nr:class I mannose-6-phosphate isomerase [Bacteroidales bacterium]
MKKLYPLKFTPILIPKVWGGKKLNTLLKKDLKGSDKIGESWELSAISEFVSVAANGFLEGNSIEDLIEIYMGELVGDQVYMKYGVEFPLLFKFIEANEKLSVQVHPDNEIAKFRHYAYGKTEMWYVVDAEKNSEILVGFKKSLDKSILLKVIEDKTLISYLNFEKIQKGDVFYIPPGRVHALLEGTVVAEIQQTSDITYRLYDWDRVGLDGKPRDLHVDLALDVIDFSVKENNKIKYFPVPESRNALVECPYFTTNLIEFENAVELNYSKLDSFVVYMCLKGEFELVYGIKKSIVVKKGETILVPAEIEHVILKPKEASKILETYIPFVFVDDDE